MKKTTLQDFRDILVNSPEASDRHIWGVVTRQNKNAQGKVTSYEVALGGDEGSMTCRKLAGADVGDTVMVTLTKKGSAIVTGTVDGDKDAENALTAATEAQQTVDDLSDTVDGIEDLVGDGDESGITVKTQYYLSTSNTTPTGGSWQDTLPTYVAGRYYWIKTITTYADGSEVESDPILDVGAQLTAEVNSVVTAENQHFWHDNTGAYVTKADKSLTSGYAMKITSQGLLQTYDGHNLMSLTSSGLAFYRYGSNTSTPLASYSSSGATIYGGSSLDYTSVTSSGLHIYVNQSNRATNVASFGSTSTIGNTSGTYWEFASDGLFWHHNGDAEASDIAFTSTYSGGYTVVAQTIQGTSQIKGGSISGSSLSVSGSISGSSISGSSLSVTGSVSGSSGTFSSSSDAIVADYGSIKNLWAVNNASSDAVNMHIGTQGRIYQTSKSSKRFKNSISEIKLDELDPRHLYDIEVNQFKYNTDYIKNPKDARYDSFVPGFIAEQMYEHYPVAIDLDEEGKPNDWNMKFIIPPMLALIQEQRKELDEIGVELAEIRKKLHS